MRNSPSLTCNDERKRPSNYRAYDVVVPDGTFKQLKRLKPLPGADMTVGITPPGRSQTLDIQFDNGPKAVRPWLKGEDDAYLVNSDPWGDSRVDPHFILHHPIRECVRDAIARASMLCESKGRDSIDESLLGQLSNSSEPHDSNRIKAMEKLAIRDLAPRRQHQVADALVSAVKGEISNWFAKTEEDFASQALPTLNTVVEGEAMAAMRFGLEADRYAEPPHRHLEGQAAGQRIRHLWMARVILLAQMEIQRLLKEQLDVKGPIQRFKDGKLASPVDLSPTDLNFETFITADVPNNTLNIAGYVGFADTPRPVATIEHIGFKDAAPRKASVRTPRARHAG